MNKSMTNWFEPIYKIMNGSTECGYCGKIIKKNQDRKFEFYHGRHRSVLKPVHIKCYEIMEKK